MGWGLEEAGLIDLATLAATVFLEVSLGMFGEAANDEVIFCKCLIALAWLLAFLKGLIKGIEHK